MREEYLKKYDNEIYFTYDLKLFLDGLSDKRFIDIMNRIDLILHSNLFKPEFLSIRYSFFKDFEKILTISTPSFKNAINNAEKIRNLISEKISLNTFIETICISPSLFDVAYENMKPLYQSKVFNLFHIDDLLKISVLLGETTSETIKNVITIKKLINQKAIESLTYSQIVEICASNKKTFQKVVNDLKNKLKLEESNAKNASIVFSNRKPIITCVGDCSSCKKDKCILD